ncbi:hypothetical protein [uncultured Dysgonomonas sp.]|uniref:Secreted protein n=1 Tax=uncultured Dysgonomonas sp. TaxID=206096 RepID=A0A212J870_9BACT|nr:hypothetical protein [uncultured Dysgonomonas sp.]SBV95642.1 conserved exported hypothetical protein [uncultured Dysgonomonas sp.]
MIKYTLILFSILTSPLLTTAQTLKTESDTHIFWQPNRKLTVADFKGECCTEERLRDLCKEKNMCTMAYTGFFSILDIPKKKKDRGKLIEKAYFAPAFEKNTSYMVFKNDTLGIEKQQIVFDIYELAARKVRKDLDDVYKTTNAYGTIHLMYGKVKDSIDKYRTTLVELFVKDTYLDNREGAYKEWREKIDEELDKLRAYATTPEDCYRFVLNKPMNEQYVMAEVIYP